MNRSKRFLPMILPLFPLVLAVLACNSFQVGVINPASEASPQPTTIPTEAVEVEAVTPAPTTAVTESSSVPVVAWLGKISSLPEESQYDDFVALSPSGTGEFGLAGATEEVEADIRSRRDVEGAGEYVHLWGNLICGVEDYNGCRLVVDRIQYGANFSEEEVKDWEGTIRGTTFNSADSYVFELPGEYPMWYSVYASQDGALRDEIERQRDTGSVVRVSGKLMVGVPDVNGTRIEVSSLEVLEEGSEKVEPLDEVDPTAAWPIFVNSRYGYQIKTPTDAELSFHGPAGFSPGELPEGKNTDEYLAELTKTYTDRLCVQISHGLGVIYISAPPNQEYFYTPCGPTGVGAAEIEERQSSLWVGGQMYPVNTMEVVLRLADEEGNKLKGDTLDMHYEMNYVRLEDNTKIYFGSVPRTDATYEDYLMKTRETLLQILETYQDLD